MDLTFSSLNKEFKSKTIEALVILLFSTILLFVSTKLFSLNSRGIITLRHEEGLTFIIFAFTLCLWDFLRQMNLARWEKNQDEQLLTSIMSLEDEKIRFSWFRVLPLIDGYRKTYIHELVPTFWLLTTSAFYSFVVIIELGEAKFLLAFFYFFYLFILYKSVRKHIELRRQIELQITECQSVAFPLMQRQLDWIVSGRLDEFKKNLTNLFDKYWPILSATLHNSIIPTLLLDFSWALLYIGACFWKMTDSNSSFSGDSTFLSIIIFELFKTISNLNGNCFKIGETIQLRESLGKVLETFNLFKLREKYPTFKNLKLSKINFGLKNTDIKLNNCNLALEHGEQHFLYSFDRNKTEVLIGLISKTIKQDSGLVEMIPEDSPVLVLDRDGNRDYLSKNSITQIKNKLAQSKNRLTVIDSLLDYCELDELKEFMQYLKAEKQSCLFISHNKKHFERIEDFKILN